MLLINTCCPQVGALQFAIVRRYRGCNLSAGYFGEWRSIKHAATINTQTANINRKVARGRRPHAESCSIRKISVVVVGPKNQAVIYLPYVRETLGALFLKRWVFEAAARSDPEV